MIELAPHNKRGLALRSPLIGGSSAFGFGDAWPPGLLPAHFGAIVTAPISWAPQRGPAQPRLAEIPGGFLLATGDQNPGYRRVMEEQGVDWVRLGVPVIVALGIGDPGDWARLAEHLDEQPGVAGLELQLAEDGGLAEARAAVAAVRRATTLPLLAKLPYTRVVDVARACLAAGADALVAGTPPRGAYPAPEIPPGGEGGWVEAPVAGPVAFPFTLAALRRLAGAGLGAPLVAAGGIQSLAEAARCLELGAAALQIRSLVWTDPAAAARLSDGLRDLTSLAP